MSKRRILLSIDWDFFCREDESWDWGHREGGAFFSEAIWVTRFSSLKLMGINPHKETSPNRFKPKAREFASLLTECGWTFADNTSVCVEDSHMWAHPFFEGYLSTGEVYNLVNIDAHADFGYGRKNLSLEHIDCANWLWALRERFSNFVVHQVYPSWKGMREYKYLKESRPEVTDAYFHHFYKWTKYVIQQIHGEVAGMFIAKSSAWTPPWHDDEFVRFVHSFMGDGVWNLCRIDSERPSPLKSRPFSVRAANSMADQIRAFQESVQ